MNYGLVKRQYVTKENYLDWFQQIFYRVELKMEIISGKRKT